jgi:hypothetical protein
MVKNHIFTSPQCLNLAQVFPTIKYTEIMKLPISFITHLLNGCNRVCMKLIIYGTLPTKLRN